MGSKKQSSPKVSLASELSVLESAVNGVRVVLEHLTGQAGGGPDPRALEGAIGLLAIVGARRGGAASTLEVSVYRTFGDR